MVDGQLEGGGEQASGVRRASDTVWELAQPEDDTSPILAAPHLDSKMQLARIYRVETKKLRMVEGCRSRKLRGQPRSGGGDVRRAESAYRLFIACQLAELSGKCAWLGLTDMTGSTALMRRGSTSRDTHLPQLAL